jgi:hypothetical protein
MLRTGFDLMALVGSATMREFDPRLLDSAAFSIVEVPGDGSCFYASIATIEARELQRVASGGAASDVELRQFVRLRVLQLRRAAAEAFSLLDEEQLALIGEMDRGTFIRGILGRAMADEPTIAMTAKVLKRPIIIVDLADARRLARCYLNAPRRVLNDVPLLLLRRGEHYDALVEVRTKRRLKTCQSI